MNIEKRKALYKKVEDAMRCDVRCNNALAVDVDYVMLCVVPAVENRLVQVCCGFSCEFNGWMSKEMKKKKIEFTKEEEIGKRWANLECLLALLF